MTDSNEARSHQIEVAHILFMDIVSYSTLLMDEEATVLDDLQAAVRSSQAFQSAVAANELVILPTGDGMALAFFGSPEAPMFCAIEIAKYLKQDPNLGLRMGLNTGPVYRILDIEEHLNIVGGGINIAQRVMDCGDGGHILLSREIAEVLLQKALWAKDLHDLGIADVKHGAKIQLYNLYSAEVGNPELPARLHPNAGGS